MTHSSLASFISHARSKNLDHQTIRMLLLSAGWKEKDISEAMASESLGMPVPMPPDAGSARDAFFLLLSFTSLASTVGSLIFLAFDFLNRLLPDAAFPTYYYSDNLSSVRWELAILIVSYPLYIWMSRLLLREYAAHHEKLASGVRRWLTYLILFVTACMLVGDLIALIFNLLQGEITVRFLLKVAAVLVLAGLPFRYYLYSLRIPAERFSGHKIHMRYFYCSVAIVLAAVVGAFVVAGSPLRGRAERFDEQRITDLRAIQNETLNIAWGNQRYVVPPSGTPPTATPHELPQTLQEIAANASYEKISTLDPETGAPYEYAVLSPTSFELCATFSLPRDQQYDIFWNHPAGRHCFTTNTLDQQNR